MSRHIAWTSGVFKEIERVYQRAERCVNIAPNPLNILEHLELQALDEVKNNIARVKDVWGNPLQPKRYEDFSENAKEKAIYFFGAEGFATSLHTDFEEAKISVKLSPFFPRVAACTFFSLLHYLELMDGSVNEVVSRKFVLDLQLPLGGKKDLVPYELLAMQLYPWISVGETSTMEAAVTLELPGKTNTEEAGEDDVVYYAFEEILPEPEKNCAAMSHMEAKQDAGKEADQELEKKPKKKHFLGKFWGGHNGEKRT